MPREVSQPFLLAKWFVTVWLERPGGWTDTDKKGMHLKHAQELLKDYGMEEIIGCLELAKQGTQIGNLGTFKPMAMTFIRGGEPPWIERYRALAKSPPPRWKVGPFRAWALRFDPQALAQPEPEPIPSCQPPQSPPPLPRSSGRWRMTAPPSSTSPASTQPS